MRRKPLILGSVAALCAAILVFLAMDHGERRRAEMPKRASEFVARYADLHPGMTYDEVVTLIGPAAQKLYGARTGKRYCTWYIGVKGEGDFFPIFKPDSGRIEQYIDLVFDRENHLLSKKLGEISAPLYAD